MRLPSIAVAIFALVELAPAHSAPSAELESLQAAYARDKTAARLLQILEYQLSAFDSAGIAATQAQMSAEFPASKERTLADSAIHMRAMKLQNRGTDCPDPKACGGLAEDLLLGRNGQTQNIVDAREKSRAACGEKDALSCLRAGRLFALAGDDVAALGSYKRGCIHNDPDSCGAWALGLAENPSSATSSDGQKATEKMKKKCDADPRFCVAWGALLSVDYGTSKKNPEAAVKAYRQSCDANVDYGCTMLGAALLNTGGNTEKDEGMKILKASCTRDGRFSCKVAALFSKDDKAAARAFNQQGCEKGDVARCTTVATADLAGTDAAMTAVALATVTRLCPGSGDACRAAARYYRNLKDLPNAALYFKNACLLKSNNVCDAYAVILYSGNGVAQDVAQAISVSRFGCDELGHGSSCFLLADLALRLRESRAKAGQPVFANGDVADAEMIKHFDKACAEEPKQCTRRDDAKVFVAKYPGVTAPVVTAPVVTAPVVTAPVVTTVTPKAAEPATPPPPVLDPMLPFQCPALKAADCSRHNACMKEKAGKGDSCNDAESSVRLSPRDYRDPVEMGARYLLRGCGNGAPWSCRLLIELLDAETDATIAASLTDRLCLLHGAKPEFFESRDDHYGNLMQTLKVAKRCEARKRNPKSGPLAPFPCPVKDTKGCVEHDKCMAVTDENDLLPDGKIRGTGVCFAAGNEIATAVVRAHSEEIRKGGAAQEDLFEKYKAEGARLNQKYCARGCALGNISACERYGALEVDPALSVQILTEGCNMAKARLKKEIEQLGKAIPWTASRTDKICETLSRAQTRAQPKKAITWKETADVAATLALVAQKNKKLAGVNLSGKKLEGIDLAGVDLSGANLSGALLNGAKLDGANLSGARMEKTWLGGATLVGAKLDRVKADGVQRLDLTGIPAIANADFNHGDITGVCNGCTLTNVDFSTAKLSVRFFGTDLRNTNLSYAIMDGANLREANLSSMELTGVSFIRADLRVADLSNAKLNNCDMAEADMRVANLSNATLTGYEGSYFNLKKADLTDASLLDVVLKYVDLTGCSIGSVGGLSLFNFKERRFSGAILCGASVDGSTSYRVKNCPSAVGCRCN